jgi:hypothetical protein
MPAISPGAGEKESAPSAAPQLDSPTRNTYTLEQVHQEWGRIVDDIRKKKISVGTILGESSPMSVADGTLQIACLDDFHFSSLKRNQIFLTEAVNTLLGSKLRIEPILNPAGSAIPLRRPETERKDSLPNTPSAQEALSSKEHPLIETLYRDFGAERI